MDRETVKTRLSEIASDSIRIRAGRPYRIVVADNRYKLHVQLLDPRLQPLRGVACTVDGKAAETDAQGCLKTEQVVLGKHAIKVRGVELTVPSICRSASEPHQQVVWAA